MRVGLVTAGASAPLGVWPVGDGVNVAVWSAVATAVELCLFDAEGQERRIRLPERTGPVFHGHVAGVGEGARYGLRVYGPFEPAHGTRCDPAKLLVDPFAVALDAPFALHPSMFSEAAPGQDSAPFTPKAVVTAQAPPAPPAVLTPWDRMVIYEAHVKGLTRLHPDVPEHQRGTFAGLAHPAVIAHLQSLGVTTLELLPTAAWIDERHLVRLGLTNYWGYNSVAFAAPDPRLAPGGWAEIRSATQALAQAGIETVLDVVFNHTGEGDALGPTVGLRGIDNAGYYRLRPERPDLYIDDTGTGNTLALDRPQGVALAMHALRTWARHGGVAGFRFDLATVLGRRKDGFDAGAPLLAAIDQDPELCRLKMIAEPWDCGPGGYQLGRFPGAWGEWNDRFRDRVRGFWKGGETTLGHVADVLAGSQAHLAAHSRPSRGVNFVTAHDGFTLADLVSFQTKHNQANGEDNRDGDSSSQSWNNGVEGPTDDPLIQRRRLNDQRALLATLMLARGTPMLAMGAELGHSQGGNNNAYAQDNPTSWLDWAGADQGLAAFTGRLAQARAACPALRQDRFLTGLPQPHGFLDVEWRRADGAPMVQADWEEGGGATLVCALATEGDNQLSRALVVLHRADHATRVVVPEARGGHLWRLVIDSADPARGGLAPPDAVEVAARSVVLLVEVPGSRRARAPDDAALATVAARAGIAPEWWTLAGERHRVGPDTQRALLGAMGYAADTVDDLRETGWRLAEPQRRVLPPVLVAHAAEPVAIRTSAPDGWMTLEVEGGEMQRLRIRGGEALAGPLPVGRHRLRADDAEALLIVAPATAHALAQRQRGISAQLYSLRGARDAGVGDFATLVELARGAAGEGLDIVALNPLHMLFPQDRSRVSPYYPSDRRFLDPLYIDTAALGGAGGLATPQAGAELIDYEGAWAAKSAALEQSFARFEAGPTNADFTTFLAEGGEPLQRFALFHAIAETRPGQGWRQWPTPLHDPHSREAQAIAHARAHRLRYHQYLQWRADTQLAAAARAGTGLLRDLAVGPAPDGAEVWAAPSAFASGAVIGAPPDAFAPQGQVWGLPPPRPQAWRDDGYAAFTTLLRSNMRHAAGLRIDHVLGLARLFWVPEGGCGGDGAYVRYPLDDLLAVTALESVRARCVIVGEDLGTAPEELRPALIKTGVYGYRVLPFERDGRAFLAPATYPSAALACVSTHDLPPLAGWWEGADLEERRRLGLLEADAEDAALADRRADKVALIGALVGAGLIDNVPADGPLSDELAAAIHAYIAASPCQLIVAQVDDLVGERTSVNLPGTHLERPNWRRRLAPPVDAIWRHPRAAAILAALGQTQRAKGEEGPKGLP